MRAMMIAVLCLASATLASCATTKNLDLCKGAETRRALYTAAIAAADGYAATGRPVPPSMTLGREAAVTAIIVLDSHCPRAAR